MGLIAAAFAAVFYAIMLAVMSDVISAFSGSFADPHVTMSISPVTEATTCEPDPLTSVTQYLFVGGIPAVILSVTLRGLPRAR